MLQLHPVYSLWNRRKTLTGSPDPTSANGTNKSCNGIGKAKLAILTFLSCGEFVKTELEQVQNWNSNIAKKCLSVPLELDLSQIELSK